MRAFFWRTDRRSHSLSPCSNPPPSSPPPSSAACAPRCQGKRFPACAPWPPQGSPKGPSPPPPPSSPPGESSELIQVKKLLPPPWLLVLLGACGCAGPPGLAGDGVAAGGAPLGSTWTGPDTGVVSPADIRGAEPPLKLLGGVGAGEGVGVGVGEGAGIGEGAPQSEGGCRGESVGAGEDACVVCGRAGKREVKPPPRHAVAGSGAGATNEGKRAGHGAQPWLHIRVCAFVFAAPGDRGEAAAGLLPPRRRPCSEAPRSRSRRMCHLPAPTPVVRTSLVYRQKAVGGRRSCRGPEGGFARRNARL